MSDAARLPDPPATDAVPAATVVLLRDGVDGIETLMLHRDANLDFAGGAWVFPGGRVDPDDHPDDGEVGTDAERILQAARNAAVRETFEEAGLRVQPDDLVWFAHWTPATSAARRFATWFFAVRAPEGAVVIDDGEIRDHDWVRPADVLRRHTAGEVSLLPPTWMTLSVLGRAASVDGLLDLMRAEEPSVYLSKIARSREGVTVAMWHGDAGYDDGEPDRPGARHRLWLHDDGWRFERS